MIKNVIYSIKSPYRQSMDIFGYTFGSGEHSCCIVGALRGNEIQQMAICAQLVDTLKRLEAQGRVAVGKSVMVIPCANYYSMNIGKRFWTMDNTDVNRMFPGYELGETTQRIADGLFKSIRDYAYGIQMASFYQDGEFLPHVKVMDIYTDKNSGGSDDCRSNDDDNNCNNRNDSNDNKNNGGDNHIYKSLADFGLPYGLIRKPHPYDTATLNYNWQIWGCQAYSLFAAYTDHIGSRSTQAAVNAALRFLVAKGIVNCDLHKGSHTQILDESAIKHVTANCGGIMKRHVSAGGEVNEGALLCEIIHPLEGHTTERITAPTSGTIFFAHDKQLVMEHSDIFRIVPHLS